MMTAKVAGSLLADPEFCSTAFRESVEGFLMKMAERFEASRKRCGLACDARGQLEVEELAGQSAMTESELDMFLRECVMRYKLKRVDPGATVSARIPVDWAVAPGS